MLVGGGCGGAMGQVEQAVRGAVRPGEELRTPGQAKPFEVAELKQEGLVLLLGKGRHWTQIPWEALEGIPDLLRGRGWVRTTGEFAPSAGTTSVSGYLKQFVYRETANWVVVVLEAAGVLDVDRGRPVRARLKPGY